MIKVFCDICQRSVDSMNRSVDYRDSKTQFYKLVRCTEFGEEKVDICNECLRTIIDYVRN